jgi:hypothetical protein
MGLILRPSNSNLVLFLAIDTHNKSQHINTWVKEILDVEHAGEQSITFSLCILIVVGLLFWILNGAYGLACIPVYLYKGNTSILETKIEVKYIGIAIMT